MTDSNSNNQLTRRTALRTVGAAVAGSLAGCTADGGNGGGDLGVLYEVAGSDEYYIDPLHDADRCAADGVRAFEDIEFGRDSGENFYSTDVGRADIGHMQGVARLPGGWLVQSFTKGVFLTHFPAKDDDRYQPWEERPEEVTTTFPRLPDEDRGHVGGVHAYDDIIAVPSSGSGEHRVELFSLDPGEAAARPFGGLDHVSTFVVSEHQNGAHYASILPLTGNEWLLAVGKDSRKYFGTHNVHFYVIPELSADQSELRYLGHWGRGNTLDDFQSLSLIADCNNSNIFLIGTGVRRAAVNAHAKLYSLNHFRRSDGGRRHVEVNKLRERSPDSERNDCNLNAGATFFPTADEGLAMYCTEKEIRDGSITTREYIDEDG